MWQSNFLPGFAQRGMHSAGVGRLGATAGETNLAGVLRQGVGAAGQNHAGLGFVQYRYQDGRRAVWPQLGFPGGPAPHDFELSDAVTQRGNRSAQARLPVRVRGKCRHFYILVRRRFGWDRRGTETAGR